MNIFIVVFNKWSWDHPGVANTQICDVFLSLEKARAYVEKAIAMRADDDKGVGWISETCYSHKPEGGDADWEYTISEWEVECTLKNEKISKQLTQEDLNIMEDEEPDV